jgi:hypothetical protein
MKERPKAKGRDKNNASLGELEFWVPIATTKTVNTAQLLIR